MKMKLLVQSAEVRSYTSGKGTVIKSLELKGMDWPDEAEGLACEGSVVVNLPAPEGAEVGTFKALQRQSVLVDIVGYRTRAFGKEVTVEFKGRLSGNGAPSTVPPTPRAKSPVGTSSLSQISISFLGRRDEVWRLNRLADRRFTPGTSQEN